MTALRPKTGTLTGRVVQLEPLRSVQLPELFEAIGSPEVFAGGYGGGAAGFRDSVDGFIDFAERYYRWDSGNVYAVRLLADDTIVGTTTLADFDLPAERAHIGWTAYAPRVWGTAVNPEAKLLLLGLAFDSGFGRVKLQADSLNARSRSAILKLGATFEGITRRDARRADGSWRDAAIYSIIVDEWPEVRARLEERVAGLIGH